MAWHMIHAYKAGTVKPLLTFMMATPTATTMLELVGMLPDGQSLVVKRRSTAVLTPLLGYTTEPGNSVCRSVAAPSVVPSTVQAPGPAPSPASNEYVYAMPTISREFGGVAAVNVTIVVAGMGAVELGVRSRDG